LTTPRCGPVANRWRKYRRDRQDRAAGIPGRDEHTGREAVRTLLLNRPLYNTCIFPSSIFGDLLYNHMALKKRKEMQL